MEEDPLIEELKKLRDRQGIDSPKNVKTLGPKLREIWGIPEDVPFITAMRIVRDKMNKLASFLEGQDRLIFRAMFRLDGGPESLMERRKSLADTLQKSLSLRTIQDRENAVIAMALSRLEQDANMEPREADDESADKDDDTLYVGESPFAREFHLEGFYWNRLIVMITVGHDRSLRVHEVHSITATSDGVDAIGMVVFPDSIGVDTHEIKESKFDIIGYRRYDTLTTLSDSMAIRTVWLERPLSSDEETFFHRRFSLPPGSGYYTVSPVCRFDSLTIEFDAHALFYNDDGEALDNPPGLTPWIMPGIPPGFVPELISQAPYYTAPPTGPPGDFWPQHYCWTPDYSYDEKYKVHFENLIPGLTYGIGWIIDEYESEYEDESPRPQNTEDGEGISGESE